MASVSFVEIISHFVGYLQIFQDIARDRIEYDEILSPHRSDDYTTPRPNYDNPFTPDDLDIRGSPPPNLIPDDPVHLVRVLPVKALGPLHDPDVDFFPPSPGPNILLPMFSGGGGGGGSRVDHHIKVVYQVDGDQSQVEVHQHNIMSNNDTLLVFNNDGTLPANGLTTLLNADAMATIKQMADDANAHVPSDWWIPQNGTGATDFLAAHDAKWAANGGTLDPNSVHPGYYLNGVLQDPAPTPPDHTPLAAPAPLPDTGHGLGQWAVLGSNDSTNAALIVDLTHAARTMIVMGDYFKTNAMFQTNTTIDHDHISTSGGQGTPSVTSGGDVANNIADFVQHPGIYSTIPVTYAGPNWSVDVVNGDYYNVHSVVQNNYLSDNDVITQTSADTHYNLVAGHNQLGNLSQIFDGSVHYDLIVVEGGYHGMNVIFQNNILLNNDQIKMAADGADPSQSVNSGNNTLLNEGTIENYGGDHFSPLSADAKTIDSLLAAGATSLDPNLGAAIAGNGGTFHVLYITGHYYHVNAVWQNNVTSDVNVIYQLQDQPSPGAMSHFGDGAAKQSVSTGNDRLANDAAIIDVNPDNTYVNGHVYTDSILVQANLLPVNQHQAVNADAHALVPELIAFVNDGHHETHMTHTTIPASVHADPMAGMLH
jgi:hypothetical protein